MEIKYELHLGNLHVQKDVNGVKDVVVSIEYTYSGSTVVDGFGYAHGITRSAMVMQNVEDINHDNVIDFKDITKEMALEWVNNTLSEQDIASMKNTIRMFLENETKYASRQAPWLVSTAPQMQVEKPLTK